MSMLKEQYSLCMGKIALKKKIMVHFHFQDRNSIHSTGSYLLRKTICEIWEGPEMPGGEENWREQNCSAKESKKGEEFGVWGHLGE